LRSKRPKNETPFLEPPYAGVSRIRFEGFFSVPGGTPLASVGGIYERKQGRTCLCGNASAGLSHRRGPPVYCMRV